MYCRCINNERINKTFMVGYIYQYTVNDKECVTVYDPYTNFSTGFIEPHSILIDDFVSSFELTD